MRHQLDTWREKAGLLKSSLQLYCALPLVFMTYLDVNLARRLFG